MSQNSLSIWVGQDFKGLFLGPLLQRGKMSRVHDLRFIVGFCCLSVSYARSALNTRWNVILGSRNQARKNGTSHALGQPE